MDAQWQPVNFIIDSGADISIVALKNIQTPVGNLNCVRGIGGSQSIGPKINYTIRFSCNPNKLYHVDLCEANLNRNEDLVILGKDFLSQFNSTEFDWRNQKIRLGDTWHFSWKGKRKSGILIQIYQIIKKR